MATSHTTTRTRWAAFGAAVAISLGAGGVGLSQAALNAGDKPVFVAITPCRLADTRPGAGNIGGRDTPLGADDTLELRVTGSTGECTGIPVDAVAAALNVTAIRPTAQSFLTVYPADAPLPNASSLNWGAGDPPTPNKVDTDLSGDGRMKLTNSVGQVHVAVDLVGYYVDHTHDDRYYRKDQVDGALDAKADAGSVYSRSEVDAAIGAAGVEVIPIEPYVAWPDPFDYVPELVLTAMTTTFTSTVDGHVEVAKAAEFDVSCSGSPLVVTVFLAVDGVGIPGSGVLIEATGHVDVRLTGVTEVVVPAGEHDLDIAVECLGATNEASLVGYTNFATASVMVHPAG